MLLENLHFFGLKTVYNFLLFPILAALLIIQNGCSSNDNDARNRSLTTNEQDLTGILKRGKIRVLAENSSTSYFIYKGKKMGFEFELLQEFADDLGVELEIITVNDLDEITTKLNEGEGDIIACNYTITRDRLEEIAFSKPFFQTNQVLVQRKVNKKQTTIPTSFISNPLQLGKKKIVVWEKSSYYDRLINLQDEIGDSIYIRTTQGNESVEELIEQVSEGQIDYTVAEKNSAQINAIYYDNIDVRLAISFQQNVAFGLRKNTPLLKKRLDSWLQKFMQRETFAFIRRKYFEQPIQIRSFQSGDFSSKNGRLSPYDDIIKREASKNKFDWRLLAALIYQESKFDPTAQSFGGAYGMMQFMPGTGPKFGVYPESSPEEQIAGGMKYLTNIATLWSDIPDSETRNKFVLASYNAGSGHIKDAQRLALKRGLNPKKWEDNVEKMVLNLGKHEFYSDPVVKSGAIRRNITCRYVREIMSRYESYKSAFK